MAKKVIRLTEQELSKVLSDVLNMTGIFGKNKMKSSVDKTTTSSSSDSDVSDIKVSAKGQELLNN
jgi:hypothetical protein